MGAFVFRLTPFAHSNQCDLILFSRDFERTRAVTVSSCGALPLPIDDASFPPPMPGQRHVSARECEATEGREAS